MLGADDPTFTIRLVLGLTALGILAVIDFVRHPHNPTRIKEYSFLFAVAGVTMAYGLVHDLVTYSISWEYFAVGKGIPEARAGFGWPVIRLALMATWGAGLFIGLTLLVANNPKSSVLQLDYRALARKLAWPLSCSIGAAIFGAVVGATFAPAIVTGLGLDLIRLEDPRTFVIASGIHAGSYLGGVTGVVVAVMVVRRKRRSWRR